MIDACSSAGPMLRFILSFAVHTAATSAATATIKESDVVHSWLQGSKPGYCRTTKRGGAPQPASCVGESGSFLLNSSSTSSWQLAVRVCLSYCRSCPRCASISVSRKHNDCRWFSSAVDCTALKQGVGDFKSGPLAARNSFKQQLGDEKQPKRAARKHVRNMNATEESSTRRKSSTKESSARSFRIAKEEAAYFASLSLPFIRCKHVTNTSAAAPCLVAVDRGEGVHLAGHRNRHGAGFCSQLPQTYGPANSCNDSLFNEEVYRELRLG